MKSKLYLTVLIAFAIICMLPTPSSSAQSLVRPVNGATLDNGCDYESDPINWHFVWGSVPIATKYQLYVYHVGSEYPLINITISSNHYSYESYGHIINSNTSNWRWRVRCQTLAGIWLPWTPEHCFNVEPLNTDCPDECVPEPISPVIGDTLDNGCEDQSDYITWHFDWSDCEAADRYHLRVYHEGAVYDVINNENILTSEYTYHSIGYITNDNSTNWKWKVRAETDGSWSDWSDLICFNIEPINTDCEPCIPELTSPADGDTLDNGCYGLLNELYWNFYWEECPNADRHHLQVNKTGETTPILDIDNLSGGSYTWVTYTPENNDNLTGYSWRVRSKKDGVYGPWSESRSFVLEPINTDCPEYCVPELLSPADTAIMDNGCENMTDSVIWQFDWTDCEFADRYQIVVYHEGSALELINENVVLTSDYTYKSLGYITEANRYNWVWKVRAEVDGFWLEWSDLQYFTVEPLGTDCEIPAPILVSPSDSALMDNGCIFPHEEIVWNFRWEEVPDAQQYHLMINKEGETNPYYEIILWGQGDNYDFVSHNIIYDDKLEGYSWKVRAWSYGVWGPWSESRSFTVEPLNTDCIGFCVSDLISPVDSFEMDNGCQNMADSIIWQFEWIGCDYADRYHIMVFHEGAETAYIDDEFVMDSEYTHKSLGYISNAMRYNWVWKVRAGVDIYWFEWSEPNYFDVEPLNTDCQTTTSPNSLSNNTFSIYPNPVTDRLNIQFVAETKGSINLNLLDQMGKILRNECFENWNANDIVELDLSDYKPGIYYIQLIGTDSNYIHKLIKE